MHASRRILFLQSASNSGVYSVHEQVHSDETINKSDSFCILFGFLVHSPIDVANSNKSCNVGGVAHIISILTTSTGVAIDTGLSNTHCLDEGAASTNSINTNNDVTAVPLNNSTFDYGKTCRNLRILHRRLSHASSLVIKKVVSSNKPSISMNKSLDFCDTS